MSLFIMSVIDLESDTCSFGPTLDTKADTIVAGILMVTVTLSSTEITFGNSFDFPGEHLTRVALTETGLVTTLGGEVTGTESFTLGFLPIK